MASCREWWIARLAGEITRIAMERMAHAAWGACGRLECGRAGWRADHAQPGGQYRALSVPGEVPRACWACHWGWACWPRDLHKDFDEWAKSRSQNDREFDFLSKSRMGRPVGTPVSTPATTPGTTPSTTCTTAPSTPVPKLACGRPCANQTTAPFDRRSPPQARATGHHVACRASPACHPAVGIQSTLPGVAALTPSRDTLRQTLFEGPALKKCLRGCHRKVQLPPRQGAWYASRWAETHTQTRFPLPASRFPLPASRFAVRSSRV